LADTRCSQPELNFLSTTGVGGGGGAGRGGARWKQQKILWTEVRKESVLVHARTEDGRRHSECRSGTCDNGTVRYWSVLLGTVQYRCRRLGAHRAHLYRIWRPKPNQTVIVQWIRTAQYLSAQRGTGVPASPRIVPIYTEYGRARRTETKSGRNRTKTYCVVPLSAVRYRCPRLTV
jgi:hypothetical protein